MDEGRGRDLVDQAYRRHRGQIYRFLLRRTGNHDDAEELTQRVFADAAFVLVRGQTRPRSVLAWLYSVAERRYVDDVRRRVVARREIALLPLHEYAPDLSYGRQVAHALKAAIADLPEDQRTVVLMKIFEGRPFAEIATTLGSTEAACKMRLSRALAQLKQKLRAQGLEP